MTTHVDPLSKVEVGVIKRANQLKVSSPDTEQRIAQLLAWFDDHLPEPDRFSVGGRNVDEEHGICWFKAEAVEHIARLAPVIAIVEEYGDQVAVRRTDQPGRIIYEDAFQVVAIPLV